MSWLLKNQLMRASRVPLQLKSKRSSDGRNTLLRRSCQDVIQPDTHYFTANFDKRITLTSLLMATTMFEAFVEWQEKKRLAIGEGQRAEHNAVRRLGRQCKHYQSKRYCLLIAVQQGGG